jgi:hypothetical protein
MCETNSDTDVDDEAEFLMLFSGAWGKVINEKNLNQKIS